MRDQLEWDRLAGPALLIVSAGLLCFDFARRVLATNDETRFPVMARDILNQGHWWLPQINGATHLNKPPLYAWLIALTAWPTGAVTVRTASVPSILAALGTVAATYWIGRRLFTRRIARAAGLIVVTTYGVFTMARVPMPDMTFCLAVTLAIAAFTEAEFEERRWMLALFYVAIGVAFWTKGPAALLALAVALVYSGTSHGWPGVARRLAVAPGLVLVALLVLPWWLADAAAGQGRFTDDIVVNDWLRWYLPLGKWHWKSVTDPIGEIVTILLPWSVLVPIAAWSASRGNGREQSASRLLLVWGSTIFVLVAIGQQQRIRYYLPLCPPAALLIAVWCSNLQVQHRRAVLASGWLAAALGLSLWQIHAGARHNAATDLTAVSREARQSAKPVYALEVPELVLTFYLERPVALVPDYARFRALVETGHAGYLVIADRAMPLIGASSGPRRIGSGLVNGHRFSILSD